MKIRCVDCYWLLERIRNAPKKAIAEKWRQIRLKHRRREHPTKKVSENMDEIQTLERNNRLDFFKA